MIFHASQQIEYIFGLKNQSFYAKNDREGSVLFSSSSSSSIAQYSKIWKKCNLGKSQEGLNKVSKNVEFSL